MYDEQGIAAEAERRVAAAQLPTSRVLIDGVAYVPEAEMQAERAAGERAEAVASLARNAYRAWREFWYADNGAHRERLRAAMTELRDALNALQVAEARHRISEAYEAAEKPHNAP